MGKRHSTRLTGPPGNTRFGGTLTMLVGRTRETENAREVVRVSCQNSTMSAKRKVEATRRPQRRTRQRVKPAAAARTRAAKATPVRRTNIADSGLAPGMQAINTYLAVANVTASVEFLERAFGFLRGVVLPDTDGQLRYAEMRHGNSVVMLIRKGDETTATSGASALYTYVDEVDRVLSRARQAGAGVDDAE